ncbi:MAG TPA: hypothetical protein DHV42_03985 [Lachnospiraceae bacterium]|nr:hypothetical protein [Lachnospiraceae bacterium]
MNKAKRTDRIILIVLAGIALLLAVFLWRRQSGTGAAPGSERVGEEVSYKDYNGRTIGILTGTNMEAATHEYFPDSQYLYFDGYPNLNAAILSGKIDAYLADEPAMKMLHANEPRIDYIKKRLTNNRYSFAFRKNDPKEQQLLDQFNEFLRKIKQDGTYDEIDSTWLGNDESKKVVDMSGLTGENGTVHVITTSTDEPFSYIKDGEHVGYDIDVAVRFCREYGYAIEIGDVSFEGRIPALESGKYDFTTTLNVTPEREEVVMFSEPVSEGGIVVAVRSEDLAAGAMPTVKDYAGKTIGSAVGTTYDQTIRKNIPDAKISYYTTWGDMLAALETGKIDAFCADDPVVRSMMRESDAVAMLPDKMEKYSYGFAFKKDAGGKKLCDEFSAYIRECKENGTLEELDRKWFEGETEEQTAPDLKTLTPEHGTLKMITDAENPPFDTLVDGKIAGYETDLAYRFCKDRGYGLQVENVSFSAILPAVQAGACDFAAASMTITPERSESVYFAEPHYEGGAVLAVRASDLNQAGSTVTEKKNFFQRLAFSFERNFIRENRWKLILSGIGVTLLITVLSALFGSVLAFGVCMFRRTGSTLARIIANIYVKIFQGTPMVVVLMILYYIIFGKSSIPAIWVAVIGFTLNVGAYGSEIMHTAIESIDGGQEEAALALGYTDRQAFYGFIFPQSAVRFLPVYRGEMINLLKSTSIVGYIAIQDLTKMSDIIRSRTYEAFFPLIATALIYFFIAWLIRLCMEAILNGIDWNTERNKKKKKQEYEKLLRAAGKSAAFAQKPEDTQEDMQEEGASR